MIFSFHFSLLSYVNVFNMWAMPNTIIQFSHWKSSPISPERRYTEIFFHSFLWKALSSNQRHQNAAYHSMGLLVLYHFCHRYTVLLFIFMLSVVCYLYSVICFVSNSFEVEVGIWHQFNGSCNKQWFFMPVNMLIVDCWISKQTYNIFRQYFRTVVEHLCVRIYAPVN